MQVKFYLGQKMRTEAQKIADDFGEERIHAVKHMFFQKISN